MSETYDYEGTITVTPELSIKQAKTLEKWHDRAPADAPSGWCPFSVDEDGNLVHAGGEGEGYIAEWITYLLGDLLKGRTLDGEISEECPGYMSKQNFVIEENVIYVVPYEFSAGPKTLWSPS